MYSRNTTAGQWRAHGRYIARESAAGDHRGSSLDSGGTDRGPAQILEGWQKAGDPRLWKLIVSPEFGDRVNLDDLTRDLMRRMEQDLGTRLEWIAVPHFNTEHPHVHIALRGIRDDGTPLQMERDYIRSGIRTHAEEICTRQLGLRSSWMRPRPSGERSRLIGTRHWTGTSTGPPKSQMPLASPIPPASSSR